MDEGPTLCANTHLQAPVVPVARARELPAPLQAEQARIKAASSPQELEPGWQRSSQPARPGPGASRTVNKPT